jgi:hypothetical protein
MSQLPAPRPATPSIPLAAALAALAFTPFAQGAVVLSNFSGVSGGNIGTLYVNSSEGEAVQITTGSSSNWTLSSVSILSGYVSGSASFQIWSNNAGNLGNLLGTSQVISESYAGTTKTFTFSAPVNLNSNTVYWFAINGQNSASTVWEYDPDASSSSSSYGWSRGGQLSTTNFSTWSASSGRNYMSLEIDATAVTSGVPDGTATALLLLPGAALVGLGSRRRRISPA